MTDIRKEPFILRPGKIILDEKLFFSDSSYAKDFLRASSLFREKITEFLQKQGIFSFAEGSSHLEIFHLDPRDTDSADSVSIEGDRKNILLELRKEILKSLKENGCDLEELKIGDISPSEAASYFKKIRKSVAVQNQDAIGTV